MKDVVVQRGGLVESAHRVHAAVVNVKGEIIAKVGDPNRVVFCRSAAKPFQAVPLVEEHILDEFGINPNELAVICASHSGEPKHIEAVRSILDKIGLREKDLECGPHPPFRESAAIELYAKGKEIGPVYNNCSGKHAAFLATCKKLNWPLETYLKGDHPLQVEIFRIISELLEIPLEQIYAERDDCGAPTLYMKILEMAKLYSLLSSSDNAELEQISRAMTTNPTMISDHNRFDTEVIQASHGHVISKGGAEGIQCFCKVNEGMGLAIKVEDGSKEQNNLWDYIF